MNIENIEALADQLQSLGFENTGYSLLKRICFKPGSFFLSHKTEKGKDQVTIHLFFEKNSKQNAYVLMYYDAILQKEMSMPDATINGINTATLEKRMAEIDWKSAFDFDITKQWSADDEASWKNEQKIESFIEDIHELEKTEEGRAIAVCLKLKYWAGTLYHELVGNISPLKNKLEVSQRFYFFEGQAGISVDEAYRFLQNRWLEKQMQAKSKQKDDAENGETKNGSKVSSGNGLLKKKRLSRSKGIKANKTVQNK
jgi:hypothetical protein